MRSVSIGDRVYGLIPATRDGSLADYALAIDSALIRVDSDEKTLSTNELACVPYAGCTAWMAACCNARLSPKTTGNCKVWKRSNKAARLILVGSCSQRCRRCWKHSAATALCMENEASGRDSVSSRITGASRRIW